MRTHAPHRWNVTPREAVALQWRLAESVAVGGGPERVRLAAGADASYFELDGVPTLIAAVVVIELPSLEIVESASVTRRTSFPYVPGLLSFREIPGLLAACRKVKSRPDVVICDGHGLAHPRRFGLACHLGLCLRVPTIGCAKTLLVGAHEVVPPARGRWRKLLDRGETVGAAVRTRNGAKPVYVSCGHRISLRRSVGIILRVCGRYRLPEPTRQADLLVSRRRRELLGEGG